MNDFEDDKEDLAYCKNCKEVGIISEMKKRLYPPDENGKRVTTYVVRGVCA